VLPVLVLSIFNLVLHFTEKIFTENIPRCEECNQLVKPGKLFILKIDLVKPINAAHSVSLVYLVTYLILASISSFIESQYHKIMLIMDGKFF
jgi:hypothetical protein